MRNPCVISCEPGVDGSIVLVREHHPRLGSLVAGSPEAEHFKLAYAQLTIARHYDLASWKKLSDYVGVVNRLTRSPHGQLADDTVAIDASDDDGARVARFLRLACLNYGADNQERWCQAVRLLRECPHLAGLSIFTAAAVGDVAAAATFLAPTPRWHRVRVDHLRGNRCCT